MSGALIFPSLEAKTGIAQNRRVIAAIAIESRLERSSPALATGPALIVIAAGLCSGVALLGFQNRSREPLS